MIPRFGSTDELGFAAAEDRLCTQTTCTQHLRGLDHKKLTYRFQAREVRLTDVYGEVVQNLRG